MTISVRRKNFQSWIYGVLLPRVGEVRYPGGGGRSISACTVLLNLGGFFGFASKDTLLSDNCVELVSSHVCNEEVNNRKLKISIERLLQCSYELDL